MSRNEEGDLGQLVASHPTANSRRIKPTPVTVSGISFVSTFWLIFTTLILCGLVVAAAFPHWIENDVESVAKRRELGNILRHVDIGLFHFCYSLTATLDTLNSNTTFKECTPYLLYDPPVNYDGSQTNLNAAKLVDISYLFSASILYAFAFLMLVVSLVVGVIAYFKPRVLNVSMFAVACVFQVVGGVTLVVSLALLPVSFESDFMKQFCGEESSYYFRGMCNVDWALYVAMVVTACALYLPSLAIFAMNISDGLRANICC